MLNVEFPLSIIANNLTLVDTSDFNLERKTSSGKILEGKLFIYADNGYPFNANLSLQLLDENNNVTKTLVVENNIAYRQELKVDEEVDINLIYFNHDKKRLHYKFEMINKGNNTLSATFEALALYVNLKNRKVSEFEQEKILIMQNFIRENKQNFNQEDLKYSSKLKI